MLNLALIRRQPNFLKVVLIKVWLKILSLALVGRQPSLYNIFLIFFLFYKNFQKDNQLSQISTVEWMSDATSQVGGRATFTLAGVKNTSRRIMKDLLPNNECTHRIQVVSFPVIFYYNFLLPLRIMKIKFERRITNLIEFYVWSEIISFVYSNFILVWS